MPEQRMTEESIITTELRSGFQGLGGGVYQQAFCNSARMALLAISEKLRNIPKEQHQNGYCRHFLKMV
jgi:hypothetical protein